MKTHWLTLLVIAAGLLLVTGCAQQAVETEAPQAAQPTTEAPPTEAPMEEGRTLDTSQLPPPMPEVAASPDVYGGNFAVNEDTVSRMRADGVPGSVIDKLEGLRGQSFENATAFRSAVSEALGEEDQRFLDTVVRNALTINVADLPPAPEGELTLAEAERRAQMRVPEFERIYFDFDRSEIKPEFREVIRANADKLLQRSELAVVIEGHADERGTNEYNLALGERRAQSVRRALIAEGVPGTRMTTVSYGEERPAALGHNEEAWAKNRRAVITPR